MRLKRGLPSVLLLISVFLAHCQWENACLNVLVFKCMCFCKEQATHPLNYESETMY